MHHSHMDMMSSGGAVKSYASCPRSLHRKESTAEGGTLHLTYRRLPSVDALHRETTFNSENLADRWPPCTDLRGDEAQASQAGEVWLDAVGCCCLWNRV